MVVRWGALLYSKITISGREQAKTAMERERARLVGLAEGKTVLENWD